MTERTGTSEQLDPRAALFLALVNSARPGISDLQARANGARYRARLGMVDGMTAEAYETFVRTHRGLALIVHLDGFGRPDGVHRLLPHYAAERFVAGNPNAVIVAKWGVGS